MVPHALCPREHGVVVRHRDDLPPVHRADTADEAVGRCALDELLERAAPALSGDDERCVLHEAAVVDEVGNVLACGPAAGRVAPLDGVGSAIVTPHGVSFEHLGQVGPDAIEVDGRDGVGFDSAAMVTRLDHDECVTLHDRLADRGGERSDNSRALGRDDVLHLHRFEHDELLARAHLVALSDIDRHDRGLHRRVNSGHGACLALHGDRRQVVADDDRAREVRGGLPVPLVVLIG